MKKTLLTAGAFALLPVALHADIVISDAYARSSNPKAGAAFMVIENTGDTADRLIGVQSEIAARTELHTHMETGDGIMKMMHVEEGFEIPAGGTHMLKRGGDHVMFMGLTEPMGDSGMVHVILTFENAGEKMVHIPIDQERQDAHAGHGQKEDQDGNSDHGGHDH